MKQRSVALALLAVLAGLLASVSTGARADVGYTQQVKLKDEAPESGTYNLAYKNYSEKMKFCTISRSTTTMRDYYCQFLGYRKAQGTARVKIATYRVVDGRKNYDYFLLDVDVTNTDRVGSSKKGWAKVRINDFGAKVVDIANTRSASYNDDRDCVALGLGLTSPMPVVSASVDLGTVTFCSSGARYSHSYSDGISTYFAEHMREIKHLSSQRVLKVPQGKRPTFAVIVSVPSDDCTKAGSGMADGNCVAYDNEVDSRTYYVGTTG